MNYREYYVSKTGSDFNAGTQDAPFAAEAGDTVVVHEGVCSHKVSKGMAKELERLRKPAIMRDKILIRDRGGKNYIWN